MKESTKRIQEYVKSQSSIPLVQLIDIARQYETVPSYEVLTNQYLGRVVNNAVAQIRDELGNRDVLSPRRGALSNLRKSKDLYDITGIEKSLTKKKVGIDQTLAKVHVVKTAVQLDMFEAIKKSPETSTPTKANEN